MNHTTELAVLYDLAGLKKLKREWYFDPFYSSDNWFFREEIKMINQAIAWQMAQQFDGDPDNYDLYDEWREQDESDKEEDRINYEEDSLEEAYDEDC